MKKYYIVAFILAELLVIAFAYAVLRPAPINAVGVLAKMQKVEYHNMIPVTLPENVGGSLWQSTYGAYVWTYDNNTGKVVVTAK